MLTEKTVHMYQFTGYFPKKETPGMKQCFKERLYVFIVGGRRGDGEFWMEWALHNNNRHEVRDISVV